MDKPMRSNRRKTHKQTAHIPGPRRKPKFLETEAAEAVEAEDVVQSEAEPSDSTESEAETAEPQFEEPLKYGDIDK